MLCIKIILKDYIKFSNSYQVLAYSEISKLYFLCRTHTDYSGLYFKITRILFLIMEILVI